MISVLCHQKQTQESTLEEIRPLLSQKETTIWVDVTNPTTFDFQVISEIFQFHRLALDDVKNTKHHPKLDEYPEYLFLIVHGVDDASTSLHYKHVPLAIFVGNNYLVTFHPPFKEVNQLQKTCLEHNLLEEGATRLMHRLFDLVIDEFMPLMADIENRVNDMEDDIVRPKKTITLLEEVFTLKRTLAYIRQTVSHQRETLQRLTQRNYDITSEDDQIFFRDIYDHVIRVMDQVESLREIVSTVIEARVSLASHRLNEVMKFLTILSTIFLPLTFIVGLYGMNFRHMPELETAWGYPLVWMVMLTISITMILYFRKKRWF